MRKEKLVCGIGVNDSKSPVLRYEMREGKPKIIWKCPFYNTWRALISRCYSAKFHAKRSSYIDCSCCDEWLSFSKFKEWMEKQNWEGKQIDKDLLIPGNKIYGPTQCAFISKSLNIFTNDNILRRGQYPVGVHLDKRKNKFQASCRDPRINKQVYLGFFSDPEKAHLAWLNKKHEIACWYADLQDEERVAKALRTRYAA